VVWFTEIPRSAIMITRSRKLSLKLVYQLTHRMMICRSKCRPLNTLSFGTNPCTPSSSPATNSLHQSRQSHPGLRSQPICSVSAVDILKTPQAPPMRPRQLGWRTRKAIMAISQPQNSRPRSNDDGSGLKLTNFRNQMASLP
jgi:hypothetical protein